MNASWDLLQRLRAAPRIFELIAEEHGAELAVQKRLRREFPDDLVRAALSLSELRGRAERKFSRASEMWFDRKGLQQATSEPVARHKAGRFSGRVWDLGTGIGGDALALAARCQVVAVDVVPAVCLQAKWNLQAYGLGPRVQLVCADAERLNLSAVGSDLVHVDPDRRAGPRGRSLRVEDARPGLGFLQQLTRTFAGGAIKLSPASNFAGKFRDVEIELVSLHGEAKEATIWFGRLGQPGLWRATVLASREGESDRQGGLHPPCAAGASLAGNPLDALAEVRPIGGYLYDPDPAVVRAGLLDLAAEHLGLCRLDAEEEYLTGDRLVDSPFVAALKVLDVLPNNQRQIRTYFRGAGVGQVEIKCRRIHVDADAVRKRLPLEGELAAVLVFARLAGKARAVVCRRVNS